MERWALLAAAAHKVLPRLMGEDDTVNWIIDDTGTPKKSKHSVGVAHQYCGQSGKQDNCQVAVSLSISTDRGSLPVAWRLYLPHAWSDDPERREKTGVPDEIEFATKPALALRQIEAAIQAGYPRGTVLADAAYGDETAWREALAGFGLRYALGVRPATTVWWGDHQPTSPRVVGKRSQPRRRLKRDAAHQPISLGEVARALPTRCWRTLTWREGSDQPLTSRVARVRVRAAHRDQPRDEEWLLIEWPKGADAPAHYWFSNLPKATPWLTMGSTLIGGLTQV